LDGFQDLVVPCLRTVSLGIPVNDDEIKVLIKPEHGLQAISDPVSGRRVQAAEVRSDYVKFTSMTGSHASYVETQRLVGRSIGQKQSARHQASVREIWRSGGVVR
jgi:hypothetical protein